MGVNGTIKVTDPSGAPLCEVLVDPEATIALLKEMLQIEVRLSWLWYVSLHDG